MDFPPDIQHIIDSYVGQMKYYDVVEELNEYVCPHRLRRLTEFEMVKHYYFNDYLFFHNFVSPRRMQDTWGRMENTDFFSVLTIYDLRNIVCHFESHNTESIFRFYRNAGAFKRLRPILN